MKEQKIRFTPIPSTAEVEAERERLAYRSRYMRVLRSTVYTLLVVAAVAVLLATLFLPVLQVSGDSMNPTLQDRDIILLVKGSDMKTGDLCGFYWQNKLLLKRIIGLPGDVIELDEDGVVTVNGQTLGSMLLALPDDDKAAAALEYIRNYPGITFEEVNG
jgi:signal peptidase I